MTSFTDDFSRADSTNLGANWVEVSGDWSIVSSQLSPGAAGGTIILRAAGTMASNDNSAQFTIAATTSASQGVWCRGNANITSGYLLRNNGTSWDLFQVVGGSFTSIGTYAAAAAPGDVAKVQAVGSTITAYVNGTQRASVTNTAVTTGTSVGIRADSAGALRFDDFAAADVTAGVTLGIATSTETAQPLTGAKSATLGTAGATEAAQALVGTKTKALVAASAVEAAQAVTGTKTAALSPAGATDTAQPLAGSKTATLSVAAAQETAQALTGAKSAALTAATTSESAQPLTGTKTATLGVALEAATAQALVGSKTTLLGVAGEAQTAQPLTGAPGQVLGTAASVETAQPLAGTKYATLGIALEASTARPFTITDGGTDDDVEVTVGAPYGRWIAGAPYGATYTAGVQGSGWEVAAPW